MATGRLPGQSPGLQVTRWSKAPTAGTTTLSGLDDYSVGLTYTAGYESVYLNGVLLDRTTDYTATNGTTIVLSTATVAGDIVNVFGTQVSPVNGSVQTNTYTTKGDILVATAANTVIRQGVGANGTVLTADSTQSDGVTWSSPLPSQTGQSGNYLTTNGTTASWAAVPTGGMTLLSTTSLSGATTTISGISQSYNSLFAVITGVTNATANGQFRCAPNASTTITQGVSTVGISSVSNQTSDNTYLFLTDFGATYNWTRTVATNSVILLISNYASTSAWKNFTYTSGFDAATYAFAISNGAGTIKTNSAITSLVFSNSGGNLSTGTVLLYGVK